MFDVGYLSTESGYDVNPYPKNRPLLHIKHQPLASTDGAAITIIHPSESNLSRTHQTITFHRIISKKLPRPWLSPPSPVARHDVPRKTLINGAVSLADSTRLSPSSKQPFSTNNLSIKTNFVIAEVSG
jgi:hypothetical protein